MLAVFIQRGCAHTVEFTARQCGFQQIGCIHRAIGFARAHQRVHLINEQDDIARSGRAPRTEQPSAVLRTRRGIWPRQSRHPMSSDNSCLVAQAFRHITIDDAQCETFGDGGLADTRLTDQNRIVLGAAGQDPGP